MQETMTTIDPPLKPQGRRVLMDGAVDAMREAILNGRLPPGARLIEDELAKMLDVSRSPVRQALARLEQEGLVVQEAHRGASVALISATDVEEIYSLRTALERLATTCVCEAETPADLAPLEAILQHFSSIPRAEITRRKVAELDIDFHDAIFRAAKHQRLYRGWQALRSQVMMFLLLRDALADDYLDSWGYEHQVLLDVIRSRDVAKAVVVSQAHIGSAHQRLKAMLKRRSTA
jgi:DNA-binding GntR family transcriptional regulator